MADKRNRREITEEQLYLFHQGTNYRSYLMMGAHPSRNGKEKGVWFRVWAPNAAWVSVVGDFNNWDIHTNPMHRINDSGIWEIFIAEAVENHKYKYAIGTSQGEVLYKYDPYAYYSELRPNTASVVYDLSGYTWKDRYWQQKKKSGKNLGKPMLIYEVHLGSWKRREDGSLMNYREIADELLDYVVSMGYTHIELMPVMEHPFDGSWGYQVVGYYAVTSRYGTPMDYMYFVDQCHQKGIGVILDWVPGHFPKDAHGLVQFDGTALYEHHDPRRGEQPQWGTKVFNYSRYEVQSFLISNLLFWLDYYHVDGFRVDAVACMLYLDYAREDWIPNQYGGRENLDAAEFIRKMNETVATYYPNTLLFAEDSSQWPKVTDSVENGGLGFTHKWNMGWMNDTLRYCSMDPIYRKWHHNLLTFSLTYAFSEKYVLPLSHDEVVHGKYSLLDKMPGDYHQKFAGLRCLFGYMISHPGCKLTFMGGEFGHFIEWNFGNQLDWFLLDYEMHRKMQDYVKALNHFYLKNSCLWEDDGGWDGYQWISADDNDQSVISFLRKGKKPENFMIIVINFTPVHRVDYRIGVPMVSGLIEVFNTDSIEFGGTGICNPEIIKAENIPCHNQEQSVVLSLPPLSAIFYKPVK